MSEFTTRYLSDYKPSDFSIKTVNLTVNLDNHKTMVKSTLTIERSNETATELVLDGEQLNLISVSLNGTTLSQEHYQQTDYHLTILVNQANFEIEIETEIDPENNTSLEGLFKSGDAFCTQCEAEGFRRITYYLDRPDVMAVFTTKVIAEKSAYPFLLSNGNKVDAGELPEGRHFVKWHDPFPKPAYLFALVAGNFDLLTDQYKTLSGRDVALEIFVDKGNLHKAEHAMASLKHSMAWDEKTFGLEYDLDIYMIVAVDFFNMGAMENKGLNVFNSKYVLADKESATDTDYFNIEAVIAHEYFHNWTGNRVTCRDWFQLSLKEGLTVFRDQQFSADMHSAAVTRIQNVKVLRSMQFAEDAGPMAHPIRPEKVIEMNNFYTLTVYEKGSEVIRMIHTLLGQDGFRKGMDLYFSRYDGMAVTCDDFIDAMAEASGKDLTLFRRWYTQSGTPLLDVKQKYNTASNEFSLTIAQHHAESKSQPVKEHLHIPIRIELINTITGAIEYKLLELTQPSQTWIFESENQPIVAMLADFSAPVKVKFEQTNEELQQIISMADDYFCRWDAAQKMMQYYVKLLVDNIEADIPSSLFNTLRTCLIEIEDDAFKALLLTMPSFDELTSEIDNVDALALCDALSKLKRLIAEHLQPVLTSTYHNCKENDSKFDSQQIANRSLQNMCLSYLVTLSDTKHFVEEQYSNASNMTLALGALSSGVRENIPGLETMLKHFEQKWLNTTLVMDKWFTLNASVVSENIYDKLDSLMKREDFSLKNPNRARSLIGAFVMQNPRYFHCNKGRGYKFLADQIILLNKINPQVASRLITPLIQFKEFDSPRQKLMISELERIKLTPGLARDLIEKLDAALA
jgi:aminopeptidase N